MADDYQHDFRAHQDTFNAFNKLVLFSILSIVLTLCAMALGLVGHLPLLALLLGVGGHVVLLVAFAIMS
ncbi:MAG: aa3-type cytochrome c oxidase subunit IV [Sphingobacteriaceae bacterium]|nr:aa3-type cytochrome c oxidase subunit IV [Cytophagaceae bacterium]